MHSWIPKQVWKNITTIFIDFDGTLADSHPRLFQAYKTFMELNGRTAPIEEFKSLVGPTLPEIVAKIIEKHELKSSALQLLNSYGSIMDQVYAHEVKLFPGVPEVLEFLKSHGFRIAVVTSANKRYVDPFLKKFNIEHYFDAVFTADGTMPGKPAPDLYIQALKAMRLEFTHALAVEDSEAGVESAIAAGIYTIFLKNSPHDKLQKEYYNVVQADGWDGLNKLLHEVFRAT